MNEGLLKRIVRESATYYHRGRPHTALRGGLPEPNHVAVPARRQRYELPFGYRIIFAEKIVSDRGLYIADYALAAGRLSCLRYLPTVRASTNNPRLQRQFIGNPPFTPTRMLAWISVCRFLGGGGPPIVRHR